MIKLAARGARIALACQRGKIDGTAHAGRRCRYGFANESHGRFPRCRSWPILEQAHQTTYTRTITQKKNVNTLSRLISDEYITLRFFLSCVGYMIDRCGTVNGMGVAMGIDHNRRARARLAMLGFRLVASRIRTVECHGLSNCTHFHRLHGRWPNHHQVPMSSIENRVCGENYDSIVNGN